MAHTTDRDALGHCPRCEVPIPTSNLLIRYETTEGAALYAACPDCGDPVHPGA